MDAQEIAAMITNPAINSTKQPPLQEPLCERRDLLTGQRFLIARRRSDLALCRMLVYRRPILNATTSPLYVRRYTRLHASVAARRATKARCFDTNRSSLPDQLRNREAVSSRSPAESW